MAELLFLVLAVGLALCFLDLRWGMYATLVAGFLQDPLRKMFVDEPIYLSAVVIVFAAVTFVGAKIRDAVVPFDAIPDWTERMQTPIQVFVVLVIVQSMATIVYTGSIVLAGIGLLAYLSPFPAFLMAYSFASSMERVTGFLWLYVAACAAMASGVYLLWLGMELDLLRTVGEPLTIYLSETGEAMDLPAGFFRAPELAAWHAAAGFCISVILGLATRRIGAAWATGGLALFFLGVVFLTGRRKFIAEIVMFLPFILILLRHFKAGSGRLLWSLFAVSMVTGVLALADLVTSDTTFSLAEVASRSEKFFGDELRERIFNMTIGSFEYVLNANGFLGSGAGTGSQGAQHFGGGDEIIGLAAEGGLGKILAELGVPGFAVILWVGVSFLVYIWKTLALPLKGGQPSAQVTIGLAAFLIANGIVFINAHQSYGDLFVLLLIGTCFGFIAASRRFGEEARLPDAPSVKNEFPDRRRAHHAPRILR